MTNENTINYKDIKALGFTETKGGDSVHFDTYGYELKIFSLLLVTIRQTVGPDQEIYLEWDQPTRICRMVRTNRFGDILGQMEVLGRKNLYEIYNVYKVGANNIKTDLA